MHLFGDNGIITNTQNASIKTSMAVLEEFLQQKYVEGYEKFKSGGSFSQLDLLRTSYPDYFYKPIKETGLGYILYKGNVYFLINKSNLPKEIRDSLKGGDASTYNDFAEFKDVYGVTTNLKVYYCSEGLDSLIGEGETIKDDPSRVAISNDGGGLTEFLKDNYSWIKTDENGNILSEGLENIKNLNFENATIEDLSQLYNFSSLTKMNISNSSISNTDGLEYATLLTEVNITNSIIGDYSGLGKVSNLNVLYFYDVNDNEIDNFVDGFKASSMTSLQYFGIMNSANVTNIRRLSELSDSVKENIKYMYMYGNAIENFVVEDGFDKVYELYITENRETAFDSDNAPFPIWNDHTIENISLGSFPNLTFLYAIQMKKLNSFSLDGAPKLYGLYINNNVSLTNLNLPSTSSNSLASLVDLKCSYLRNLEEINFYSASITDFTISRCAKLREISQAHLPNLIRATITENPSLVNIDFLKTSTKIESVNFEMCTALSNLNAFNTNNSLLGLKCSGCSNLTDISGLKNNTVLKYMYLNSTNIGKDLDISGDSVNGKNMLGKNSNNVFYNFFSNKPNFWWLDVRSCYYLGYVSYLSMSNISTILLSGSNNVSADEVATLISTSTKLSLPSCTWPRVTDGPWKTQNLNSSSKNFHYDGSMLISDFQNLKNFPNLTTLHLTGSIYSSDGTTILTQSEYDEVLEDVLSVMTKMEMLTIHYNISEISFVKNMSNLVYLNLWGSPNVGTHKIVNGTKIEYDNGLKLLNTYAPKLYGVQLGSHNIDFSTIQPFVNKVSKNAIEKGRLDNWDGPWTPYQSNLNTLSSCTEIEYLFLRCDWGDAKSKTIDLSKCSNLKKIYIYNYNNENFIDVNIKLPNTSEVLKDYDGYEVVLDRISINSTLNLSPLCKKLELKNVCEYSSQSNLWEHLKGLVDFNHVNKSYLKELVLDFSDKTGAEFILGDDNSATYSMNILSNCSNLEKIYFYGKNATSGKIKSIACLSNCTKLKEIYFDNTNINVLPDCHNMIQLEKIIIKNSDLVDISGLKNCTSTSLTELNFYNNSVYDLRALRNLQYLEKINLEKNTIKNIFRSSDEGDVDNVNILNTLRTMYNNLTELYISNNKLSDISELSWALSK